jgi:hypothetical protein
MGRHARRARKRDAQTASGDPGRGQGRAVSPPAPAASAALPAGNAVPAQRQEARPEQWSPLPGEGQPVRLRVPAQAHWREKDQDDRAQLSIYTDADGRQKTYSVSGIDRASKALCRPILSCGLVVALIVVPIACIAAQGPTQGKLIWGSLMSLVTAGFVWAGAQAKRRLNHWRQKRRDKAPADGAGHG